MNPERIVHGRLTINDDKINLGRSSFRNIVLRLTEQYGKRRYEGEKLRLIVEISDTPFSAAATLLSREQQLEAEMQSNLAAPNEEVFPGVTAQQVALVMESEEYLAYEHICNPDKRIGVPDSHIESIREAYKSKYPECFDHFPLWRN